jgi:hypothetical protein
VHAAEAIIDAGTAIVIAQTTFHVADRFEQRSRNAKLATGLLEG